MTKVVVEEDVGGGLRESIISIFDEFGGVGELIKDREVFLKVNAIDFRKQCYTSPEVIAATIDVLLKGGVEEVNVIENVTQGNITRVVFHVIGLDDVVKEKGGKTIYLDEEDSVTVPISNGEREIKFPKILHEKLIENKGESFYLSIPKLKTHSMTKVTLGVKSQMGLVGHSSRSTWHNFELHEFLADVYEFVKPDFIIIDGLNAIIHGHYPLENKLNQYVEPMDILIGGEDTLAVDTVASRILGYDLEEVKHLRIASEAGLGCGDLSKIKIKGDISKFETKYPYQIIGDFPENVKIIEGEEGACPEGCRNNTLMVLEMLHVDYGGQGPFNLIYGKGLDKKDLDELTEGPVLIVGPCAIEEAAGYVRGRYSGKRVVTVDAHNDLAAVTSVLLDFMGVKVTDILPLDFGTFLAFLRAKINGSSARTPSLFG